MMNERCQGETEDESVEKLFSKLDLSSPRILCDFYGLPKEEKPRKEKILAISKQIVNALEFQMAHSDKKPADLVLVGCNEEAREVLLDRMKKLWTKSQDASFPDHLIFSKEPLSGIYLSPDAPTALDPCQPPPVTVVVGLIIDRRIQVGRSLERAKALGLKAARWPLDNFNLPKDEPLNVDTVLQGMQQWYWNCSESGSSSRECFEAAARQALQDHQRRHPQRPQHKQS
jgi:hypothetical protein